MKKGAGEVEKYEKQGQVRWKIIWRKTLFHNIEINNFAYNLGMLPFYKISIKIDPKSTKFTKTFIGCISESFHRISKIQNSAGRSGAWLSH